MGVGVLLVLFAIASGCGREPQAGRRTVSKEGTGHLATYQGGVITFDECAKWFTLFGDRSTMPLQDSNETQWVLTAVNSIAVERGLSEKAGQLGLDQKSEMLARQRKYAEEALAWLYYLEKAHRPIKISDQEIKQYYEEHDADFHEPVHFSFRMIFFNAERGGREEARRRALRIMDRIQKGAEFDSLIADNSDIAVPDRTKEFGPYRPGEGLLAPIEEAALSLKEGGVSDIIEHKKGFHIIKLTKRTDATDPPLEQVRDEILERLFEQKIELAQEQLEEMHEDTLEIQKNYHILGLPITATNDVVLRIADEVMTYGDYLDMLREGNFMNEEEFRIGFQRRYREMLYLALGRREGYAQRPEVQEWVNLNMDRERTFDLLQEEIDGKIDVSEEEIRGEYDEHKSLFHDPKMVYARQIYLPIPTRPDMSRYELIREIQNTKARSFQIIQELRQGMRFEEAARLYSTDPNADIGGVLGWVPFGYSVRFDRVTFGLDEGEITLEPIARRRGFQIVKVEKKEQLRLKTLDEAWGQIHDRLFQIKSDEAREAFVADARKRAQVRLESQVAQEFGSFLRSFWERSSIYTVSN